MSALKVTKLYLSDTSSAADDDLFVRGYDQAGRMRADDVIGFNFNT